MSSPDKDKLTIVDRPTALRPYIANARHAVCKMLGGVQSNVTDLNSGAEDTLGVLEPVKNFALGTARSGPRPWRRPGTQKGRRALHERRH